MYTMIRILPMDKKNEFDNQEIRDVQNKFFLHDLPGRKDKHGQGKYCYKIRGINAHEKTTLVLFQYDNLIVASATFNYAIKLDTINNKYHGSFYFEPSTIKIFKPIDNKNINKIFHCNIKFGQIKYNLNIKYLNDFLNQLDQVKSVNLNNIMVQKNSRCPQN